MTLLPILKLQVTGCSESAVDNSCTHGWMFIKQQLKTSCVVAGRIAAGEGRFNTATDNIINTETKSIPVNKKGVYFAFRDQGACISLLAIKVSTSYMTCRHREHQLLSPSSEIMLPCCGREF